MDNEGNPRKRPRLGGEQPKSGASSKFIVEELPDTAEEVVTMTIDPVYKSPDAGVCGFGVGGTYFKIHRHLLTRASPYFENLLAPLQSGELPGAGDNQLILLDDQIEDFRILCWALYAQPLDMLAQLQEGADVNRLRVLAMIADKYQFLSFKDCAVTAIIHQCRHNRFIDKLPIERTPEYLTLAYRCASRELQDVVEDAIIRKMRLDLDFSSLVATYEAFGSRCLKGIMRFHLLLQQDGATLKSQPGTSALSAGIWSDPNSYEARLCFRGYFSLTKWWELFVENEGLPTALPRAPACPEGFHSQHCQRQWPAQFQRWIKETNAIKPRLNLFTKLVKLKRLAVAELEETKIREPSASLCRDTCRLCMRLWGAHVADLQQQLADTMADHFYGCPPRTASA